jgi:hypothetical protein
MSRAVSAAAEPSRSSRVFRPRETVQARVSAWDGYALNFQNYGSPHHDDVNGALYPAGGRVNIIESSLLNRSNQWAVSGYFSRQPSEG